jgi:DNA ligase-1
MQVWEIGKVSYGLSISYGKIGGTLQFKDVEVACNQSGRSFGEQQELEYQSRINDQLAKGYCYSIEEAGANAGKNELNFYRPMLAQTLTNQMQSPDRYYAQPKLDGNRCLITNHNGKVIAYSRNGKVIDTIDHITNDIQIPEGVTLDGELYVHGVPLQTIMSWTKKKQPDTEKLQYYCFDSVMDKPMTDRLDVLKDIVNMSPFTVAVPTHDLQYEDMWDLFYQYKASRYEGLILRDKSYGYEAGKRSKGLIKLKTWEDDEFKVIKIEPSKDGYAILYCETNTGKVFKVTAPGTVTEKMRILENSNKYIGQYITIQYANLTPDGKCFHPVAKGWRDLDD